jgi:hypothetical protein
VCGLDREQGELGTLMRLPTQEGFGCCQLRVQVEAWGGAVSCVGNRTAAIAYHQQDRDTTVVLRTVREELGSTAGTTVRL